MGSWPAATIDRLLVVFQGEAGGGWPAEGTERPAGGRAVFHGNSNPHFFRCFFFFFFSHLRCKTTATVKICAKLQEIHTCLHKNLDLRLSSPKTLYKTQIRELRDDCDQKSKQCKEMQRRLAEYKEERCDCWFAVSDFQSKHWNCRRHCSQKQPLTSLL